MRLPGIRFTKGTWVVRLTWLLHAAECEIWECTGMPALPIHRGGVIRWYAAQALGGD